MTIIDELVLAGLLRNHVHGEIVVRNLLETTRVRVAVRWIVKTSMTILFMIVGLLLMILVAPFSVVLGLTYALLLLLLGASFVMYALYRLLFA